MKKLFTLLLLTITTSSFSQKVDKFEITPNNVNGFMVQEYEGKTAKEIYAAVKKWTQYNIYDADFAVHSDVENEYLAFNINGVGNVRYRDKKAWLWTLKINVEIRIKENKARIDFKLKEITGSGNTNNVFIKGSGLTMSLFNRKGKPRTAYTSIREDVNTELNTLSNEIFKSIKDNNTDYKKDDW